MSKISTCAYGNGLISLRTTDYNPYGMQTSNKRRFYRADLKTGELAELSASKDEGIRGKLGSFANSASAAAPVRENELAWLKDHLRGRIGLYLNEQR